MQTYKVTLKNVDGTIVQWMFMHHAHLAIDAHKPRNPGDPVTYHRFVTEQLREFMQANDIPVPNISSVNVVTNTPRDKSGVGGLDTFTKRVDTPDPAALAEAQQHLLALKVAKLENMIIAMQGKLAACEADLTSLVHAVSNSVVAGSKVSKDKPHEPTYDERIRFERGE